MAAYAWVQRDEAVLLVRASDKSDVKGLWFLPGGGIEWGEDPADAVLRELLEETGLVGVVRSILVVESEIADRAAHRLHTLRICYRVDVEDGPLIAEMEGSTDLPSWVPLAEAADLPLMPYVRELLRRLHS